MIALMKAEWIEIRRGDVMPQYSGIHVTMNTKGDIVMSGVTYNMLGAPKAFLLLYDKVNNRIGLKPAALTTRNAYPALKNNQTGKMVRGYRMMREQHIILPHTVQFDDAAIDEDGILILDLRTAVVSRRGLAGAKRNAPAATEME